MLIHDLKKLIYSLSSAEKKQLTLYTKDIKGHKQYMQLFQLLLNQQSLPNDEIKRLYQEKFPGQNFANSLSYLYKVITDMLVNFRIQQDSWYRQYQHLMKAQLCFERSIPDRADAELKSALELAENRQNHLVSYQALRMKLDQLHKKSFVGISEQDLVSLQIRGKNALRNLSQIHEHYILNELLGFRINNGLLPLNEKSDKNLNNLLLSEISLITRYNDQFYESKKLHSLFQSFYFIHIGDYTSAIKIFNKLIQLMDNNKEKLDFPPYDYLFTLEGILNSLRSIGLYDEMDYYFKKLSELSENDYSDHFERTLDTILLSLKLNRSLNLNLMDEAKELIENKVLARNFSWKEISDNKEMEILFFLSLYYFINKQYKQSRKLSQVFQQLQPPLDRFPIYRAGCLLHLMNSFEMQDYEFVGYELRNMKRLLKKASQRYLTEKLIFQVIETIPQKKGKSRKSKAWAKLEPKIASLRGIKQELEILKFYDFTKWIEMKYK